MPGPEEGSGVLSEVSLDQATDACFRRWICITIESAAVVHGHGARRDDDVGDDTVVVR